MLRDLTFRPVAAVASLTLSAIALVPIGCGSEVRCVGDACEDPDAREERPSDRDRDDCSDLPPCGDDVECAPGEDADCYEVDLCGGGTLLCREVVDKCAAYPSCDIDDVEVDSCPSEVSCYEAELCGWTILCLDGGTPHGCPLEEPTDGDGCDLELDGEVCDYYDGMGCFTSYECTTAEVSYWMFVGGGCDQVG